MATWKMLASMLAAAALASAADAADVLRLPVALKLPQGGDSPGVVTFNHDMHVDSAQPKCVTCHPSRFGILGRSATARKAVLTHATMGMGAGCGGCHGKTAFNFDDCTMCHSM
jgi:c(7)-type cytochrome triheme protein